ncbi:MAG TPA: SpoIIE family protein phosphatase [Spirochaetia bacterium]|nr:SpoIIE family protein phosphatase [Spirochaetia bacterium]
MRMRFKAKLLLFTLSVVLIPTFGLVVFFISNFNSLTRFSLEKNADGIRQSNKEFLTNLANDKARLISLQFKRAVDSVTIFGKAAQRLVDDSDELSGLDDVYRTRIFHDTLIPYKGALTNGPGDSVNVLIPPSLAQRVRARTFLRVSSFLNLLIGPVFESYENNIFLYFVGDRADPVTRAFPNIGLATVLGPSLDTLFWKDFFRDNVPYWERFYTDKSFHDGVMASVGSPVTFDPPYEDAAGQGKIFTLFYPLWNHQTNAFAGIAAADVSLQKIVQNLLAVHVARTGYAVLLNGSGEIIAMPEQADKTLGVTTQTIQRNGLNYFFRSLSTSTDKGIRAAYKTIMTSASGYMTVPMDDGQTHVLVYASLDPINDTSYTTDSWKVLINVPERETLDTLFKTYDAITARNSNMTAISLIVVAVIVAIVVLSTFLIAGRITRNIGQLSTAAEKISRKDYSFELAIRSRDEIGDLGGAFTQMSREIKGYTEHLEDLVRERTEELEKAFQEISHLNDKLKDENLRLSAELDVARRLQLMVLPGEKELASIRDLDIACSMNPADEVGGDYFDCFRSNGSVKIGIGDVTGHGLSAGVVMLMAQTAIRTISFMGEPDMKRFISMVNQVLYSNMARITEDRSMTLSLIDYHDRTCTIVGQHESVIICRADGSLQVENTNDLGMFVGFEPDISRFIHECKVRLETGDVMVLYTDGVTEAMNDRNEEFGLRRLCDAIVSCHDRPSAEILQVIREQLRAHIGKARVWDDISLLVAKQR